MLVGSDHDVQVTRAKVYGSINGNRGALVVVFNNVRNNLIVQLIDPKLVKVTEPPVRPGSAMRERQNCASHDSGRERNMKAGMAEPIGCNPPCCCTSYGNVQNNYYECCRNSEDADHHWRFMGT